VANEFKVPYATGQTLYGILLDQSAQIWNGSAFESATSAHLSTYVIGLTELATLGLYIGNFPTALSAAGTYFFAVRLQNGSSPATSDPFLGGAAIRWNGSTELFPASPGDQMDLINSPNITALSALTGAIWNALTTAFTTAGSIGKKLAGWIVNSNGTVPATDASGNSLATAAEIAALPADILATPAHLLATDSNGAVTIGSLSSTALAAITGAGSGPIPINQNTGGTDNLRYIDSSGNGVADASILIYNATDWPANPSQIQATAVTGPDGRWLAPAFVAHGTFVAVFTKPGADGPDVSGAFTI